MHESIVHYFARKDSQTCVITGLNSVASVLRYEVESLTALSPIGQSQVCDNEIPSGFAYSNSVNMQLMYMLLLTCEPRAFTD